MRSIRLRRGAALAFVLALVVSLGACGSTPAVANDPSGAVQGALSAVSSGGIGKLADFACAAHKNDVLGAFGGGADLGALTAAGIKPEDIYSAMSFSVANVATKEVTRSDTTATVHVTGDMAIKIDPEKFKTIAKAMFTAQGLPADDATINAMVNAMATQMSSTQKLDEDVKVVNEGGKWLICEE